MPRLTGSTPDASNLLQTRQTRESRKTRAGSACLAAAAEQVGSAPHASGGGSTHRDSRRRPAVSPEANALAKHRMERAEAACKDGDLLAEQSSLRGAINRYYYAAFHAARALLATQEC